jgi:hypothetical protein
VLVHSQSGTFGYKVLEARPDKVKALLRSSRRSAATRQGRLGEGTPILVVIGDNAKEHPRWKNIRQNSVAYASLQGGGRQHRSRRSADAGIRATRT